MVRGRNTRRVQRPRTILYVHPFQLRPLRASYLQHCARLTAPTRPFQPRRASAPRTCDMRHSRSNTTVSSPCVYTIEEARVLRNRRSGFEPQRNWCVCTVAQCTADSSRVDTWDPALHSARHWTPREPVERPSSLLTRLAAANTPARVQLLITGGCGGCLWWWVSMVYALRLAPVESGRATLVVPASPSELACATPQWFVAKGALIHQPDTPQLCRDPEH